MLGGYLVGALPRSERLMRTYREHAKGKLSQESINELIKEETKEAVELQIRNGLKFVTDGMLRWHDLLRPFSEGLEGVKVGGLVRWFDNNAFYKQPIILDRVSWAKPILKDFMIIESIPVERLKVIVPDPYTFSKLSANRYYRRFEDLVYDVADAIAKELSTVKASQVQLTAPSLVYTKQSKEELEVAANAMDVIRRATSAELCLHTCFGSLINAMPEILDFRVDVIGVDMTATSFRELMEYDITKDLGLGIIDARNTLLENPKEMADLTMRIVSSMNLKKVYISPSCELEFLPRSAAWRKVECIGSALGILRGELE